MLAKRTPNSQAQQKPATEQYAFDDDYVNWMCNILAYCSKPRRDAVGDYDHAGNFALKVNDVSRRMRMKNSLNK